MSKVRNIMGNSLPLEVLTEDVRSGDRSLEEALALVDDAKVVMYTNFDTGQIQMIGQIDLPQGRIVIQSAALVGLHRVSYEFGSASDDEHADAIARIGLHAARRIGSFSGEFSFLNALSFLAEKAGDRRHAEMHYLEARGVEERAAAMKEKAREVARERDASQEAFAAMFDTSSLIGDARFLELSVSPPRDRGPAEDQSIRAALEDGVSHARRCGDRRIECICWRGLAMLECELGRPREACDYLAETVRCAGELGPLPAIHGLCDQLHIALYCADSGRAGLLADQLADLCQQAPPLLACVDVSVRAAGLCARAGRSSAFARCLTSAVEEVPPSDTARWASGLNNAGVECLRGDKLQAARRVMDAALKLASADAPLRLEAMIRANRIAVCLAQEAFEEAVHERDTAIHVAEESGDPGALSFCYGNLGYAWRGMGRITEAIESFEKAIALATEAGQTGERGNWLTGLATVFLLLGDIDRAENIGREALDCLSDESFGYYQSSAFSLLGKIYRQRAFRAKDPFDREPLLQRALKCFRRAMEVAEKAGSPVHVNESRIDMGMAMVNLSSVPAHQDMRDEGLNHLREGARYARQHGHINAQCAAQICLATEESDTRAALELVNEAASQIERNAMVPLAWQVYLVLAKLLIRDNRRAEARLALERSLCELERIRGFMDPASTQHFPEQAHSVYRELANLYLAEGEDRLAWRVVTRSKARSLVDCLAHPADLDQATGTRSEDGLEQWLSQNPSTVLVEFFADGDEIHAFTWAKSGLKVHRSSMRSCEFVQFMDSFGKEVIRGYEGRGEPEHRWAQFGTALVERVLEGVPEESHLCFVPHGWTHFVPLHAFNFHGKPVIERYSVSYVPSTALLRTAGPDSARPFDITAFGDPRLDLPFARLESHLVTQAANCVGRIGRLATLESFKTYRADAGKTGGGIVLVGSHIELASTDPMSSRVLFADGELPFSDVAAGPIPAWLAFWNCCSSGADPRLPGDEMLGLVMASFRAGISTMVVTGWNIEDLSATLLSQLFFAALPESRNAASALRRAVNRLRWMTATEARMHMADWLELEYVRGDRELLAEVHCAVGRMAHLEGDVQAARDHYRQAESLDALEQTRQRSVCRAISQQTSDRYGNLMQPSSLPFAHPYFWASHFVLGYIQ